MALTATDARLPRSAIRRVVAHAQQTPAGTRSISHHARLPSRSESATRNLGSARVLGGVVPAAHVAACPLSLGFRVQMMAPLSYRYTQPRNAAVSWSAAPPRWRALPRCGRPKRPPQLRALGRRAGTAVRWIAISTRTTFVHPSRTPIAAHAGPAELPAYGEDERGTGNALEHLIRARLCRPSALPGTYRGASDQYVIELDDESWAEGF